MIISPQPEMAELEHALTVVNNWRSSHSFPLNTIQIGLREKAFKIDRGPLVAQRIKRLSSIQLKLRRFEAMDLARMQDIGGCRAVVDSVPKIDLLVHLMKASGMKHKLIREDDYIRHPKDDGYRGYHLVFAYKGRNTTYDGLRIEVQIRSRLQHAWATAVETVGTFLQQSLKSRQGEPEWLRFFALMGTSFALRERTARIPNTPWKRKELLPELKDIVDRLHVDERLRGYGAALKEEILTHPDFKDSRYFLVQLDPAAGTTYVSGYTKDQLVRASTDYLRIEREIAAQPGADAVLVSVGSLRQLRRAYPNYFLDTDMFLKAVRRATKE
jgi:hypothetical protein